MKRILIVGAVGAALWWLTHVYLRFYMGQATFFMLCIATMGYAARKLWEDHAWAQPNFYNDPRAPATVREVFAFVVPGIVLNGVAHWIN